MADGLLIGYARCSTEGQDLTAQRQALAKLCVSRDRIYADHGLTGRNRDRPGLQQARAACRQGDTLVVAKLDRLARSVPALQGTADVADHSGGLPVARLAPRTELTLHEWLADERGGALLLAQKPTPKILSDPVEGDRNHAHGHFRCLRRDGFRPRTPVGPGQPVVAKKIS